MSIRMGSGGRGGSGRGWNGYGCGNEIFDRVEFGHFSNEGCAPICCRVFGHVLSIPTKLKEIISLCALIVEEEEK